MAPSACWSLSEGISETISSVQRCNPVVPRLDPYKTINSVHKNNEKNR